MNKVVVIGSSNTDLVVRAPHIPAPGETVLGDALRVIPGGKGANQAVAAARAGGKVIFLAKVGDDDFGAKAIQGYQKEGIQTELIQKDAGAPTGAAMITVNEKTGQNAIVVAPGANLLLDTNDVLTLKPYLPEIKIVALQLEIPLETVEAALTLAKQNNILTLLDPAPAQYLKPSILKKVDILTPNETEAAILTKTSSTDPNWNVTDIAEQLLVHVNLAVIITLGKAGIFLATKSGIRKNIPTQTVDAVDTTAAGDVFNGYLAKCLADGLDLEAAIKMANAAAAISVTRVGAQPSIPNRNELGSMKY